MKEQLHIPDLASLDRCAAAFLERIGNQRIVALQGPMGAGKTTFSPTFALVNEYRTAAGEPLFHFDFYRIERLEEALDIGLYDYLDSGFLCLMEWPENIAPLLPEETLWVQLAVNPDGSRTLSWES